MYSLLRYVSLRDRLLLEAPAAVLSLVWSKCSADFQTLWKSGVYACHRDKSRTTFGVTIAIAEPLFSPHRPPMALPPWRTRRGCRPDTK